MNRENVALVRDALLRIANDKPQELPSFGMEGYFHLKRYFSSDREYPRNLLEAEATYGKPLDCGTAACMAGLAQFLLAADKYEKAMPAYMFAKDAFDLTNPEAMRWFNGSWADKPITCITAAEAAEFLTGRLERQTRDAATVHEELTGE